MERLKEPTAAVAAAAFAATLALACAFPVVTAGTAFVVLMANTLLIQTAVLRAVRLGDARP